MQLQFSAIKQLLETNYAIASVIESILIELFGESASWEQTSTLANLSDFQMSSIQVDHFVESVIAPLWRSRIALNNARINAEEVALADFLDSKLEALEDRDRQIQELQTSLRNHHEQFDALKSRTEVTLKAIAMMLESLKGDRKPDEVKEVDGVMVRFRDYDDNLTHHHKTIIIGNIQRAIANEARSLEARTLQDFSYDDQPF